MRLWLLAHDKLWLPNTGNVERATGNEFKDFDARAASVKKE
jgi:hypothetical protein